MSRFFASKGVRWVTAGWVGFITENLVLSHNREWIIQTYGDDQYHIAYNCLSTLACSSIAYGFLKHGKVGGASIPKRGPALQLLGFGVQAIGLVGLSQLAPAFQIPVSIGAEPEHAPHQASAMRTEVPSSEPPKERKLYVRCPIDFRHKSADGGLFGVERVTRHPALWSMGFAGLGAAMTTVYPTSVAMFTFPIIFAYIGGEHQDYRYRRGNGGHLTPEQDNVTSNVPFLALIQGKQPLEALYKEMKWTNAAVAVLAAALLAAKRL